MMNDLSIKRIVRILEGIEDASIEKQLRAWQALVDSGLDVHLQGWYGRTAALLIQQGLIHGGS